MSSELIEKYGSILNNHEERLSVRFRALFSQGCLLLCLEYFGSNKKTSESKVWKISAVMRQSTKLESVSMIRLNCWNTNWPIVLVKWNRSMRWRCWWAYWRTIIRFGSWFFETFKIKGLFQKLENSNYTPTAKNSPVIEEVLRNILIKKWEKNFDPY